MTSCRRARKRSGDVAFGEAAVHGGVVVVATGSGRGVGAALVDPAMELGLGETPRGLEGF